MNRKGRREREENTERENAGFGFIVKSHLSVYMGMVVICSGQLQSLSFPQTFFGGSGSVKAQVTRAYTNQIIITPSHRAGHVTQLIKLTAS